MIYDHNLTLVVPLNALDIARAINRHLDSDDVGGGEGFNVRVTDGTTVFAAYSRPCDSEYAAKAAMLVTVASELHELCLADSRFEDKPTLADCEQFCAVAECYVDCASPYEQVIEQLEII